VDYSGKRIGIVDPSTGEIREAEIFVGVLGASNLTYAEATWTQTCRTGPAPTCACSAFSVARRSCWFPTI
jgi:transposase